MALASGRTFDRNPAFTQSSLGRTFFNYTHVRTTATVVGSLRMLDLCVFEATSQLVSPQSIADMVCRGVS